MQVLAALIVGAAMLLAGMVHAQNVSPVAAATGKQLFYTYCAACHGKDARGNGPMASFSAVAVPDLTLLRRRYHGDIPYGEVWRSLPEECSEACPNKAVQVRDIQSFLATLQK
jgi:hypothetical protein